MDNGSAQRGDWQCEYKSCIFERNDNENYMWYNPVKCLERKPRRQNRTACVVLPWKDIYLLQSLWPGAIVIAISDVWSNIYCNIWSLKQYYCNIWRLKQYLLLFVILLQYNNILQFIAVLVVVVQIAKNFGQDLPKKAREESAPKLCLLWSCMEKAEVCSL